MPIGVLRRDGTENLLTAIEIASANENGEPVVTEVCILFENFLMRGNRTKKINAENFNAFRSQNYPPLARVGIHIKYDRYLVHHNDNNLPLRPHYLIDSHIVVLTIFPGLTDDPVHAILTIPNLTGVILDTFGAGNATTTP